MHLSVCITLTPWPPMLNCRMCYEIGMDFHTVSSDTSVRKSYAETYKSFCHFFISMCVKRRSATICSKWCFLLGIDSFSWPKREQFTYVLYILAKSQLYHEHLLQHGSRRPCPMATAWIKNYRTICRHLNGTNSVSIFLFDPELTLFKSQYQLTNKFLTAVDAARGSFLKLPPCGDGEFIFKCR